MRIFVGSRVLALLPASAAANALAVSSDGRIAAVGQAHALRAAAGPSARIVDLGGAVIAPGFHDAHVHLSDGALALGALDLRTASSAQDAAARVAEAARGAPEGAWIRGWGWDHTRWPAARWPEAAMLDAVLPERPVLLMHRDGHVVWLNRAGLRALGISRSTPDPEGGSVQRDAATGEPTGILLERAAESARERLPPPTPADRRRAVVEALGRAAGFGITSVQDVTEPWALEVYEEIAREGLLTLRVCAWLPLAIEEREADALRKRHPADHPFLAVGTRKVFLDGTLGSRSAALHAPYADEPGSRGVLRLQAQDLREALAAADAAGWAVAMHAIGDRAVTTALDAIEALPRRPRLCPHRIEHAQVVDPSDLPRLAATGVAVSVQPVHLVEDQGWVEARLGASRALRGYPWRSLLRAGATLAFGSDWPTAPLDPRLSLAAACSRPCCGAQERLTPLEATRAYTEGAARACGRGEWLGVLRPGNAADFVALSQDPASLRPDEIPGSVHVHASYVAGRRTHPDPEPASLV